MDCLLCTNKQCKGIAKDCNNRRDEIVAIYQEQENKTMYIHADKLVADGRAGELSRLQEIIEFARSNNYKELAIAYCFCMEDMANEVRSYFTEHGFVVSSYRCTINGIAEDQINEKLTANVNCNPIGQAKAINNSAADLAVVMGLCMGHDILFHKYIKKPVTTFIVKDRVYNNDPGAALHNYRDKNTEFLEEYLENSFGMKSVDWLKEKLKENIEIIIIDLRSAEKYSEDYLPGSINIPLKDLPKKYKYELPVKDKPIICLCSGSVQSAYAIMFLYSKGYTHVYNLSGGYSSWKKQQGE